MQHSTPNYDVRWARGLFNTTVYQKLHYSELDKDLNVLELSGSYSAY